MFLSALQVKLAVVFTQNSADKCEGERHCFEFKRLKREHKKLTEQHKVLVHQKQDTEDRNPTAFPAVFSG